MSMQFISEKLLEREIRRLEDAGIQEDNKLLYYQCKKELAVIEKLKINKIDMCGEIEKTNERISRCAIYFMEPGEFEEFEKKANLYDTIKNIVRKDGCFEKTGMEI